MLLFIQCLLLLPLFVEFCVCSLLCCVVLVVFVPCFVVRYFVFVPCFVVRYFVFVPCFVVRYFLSFSNLAMIPLG